MSDAATATAPAPTAAPAAPAPAPAVSAPAPAAASAPTESLFSATPPAPAPAAGPAPAPAPAAEGADPWAKVPEKYLVKGADGAVDQAATLAKLNDGYAAAVKRIGTGDLAPESPDAYQFTPPEDFKDTPLDPELTAAFKAEAHKAGLTQQQYEFVMNKYFQMVPSVLGAAVQMKADEARAELGKVWQGQGAMEAGFNAAERARAALPESLRAQVEQQFGTNPLAFQVLAHFGKQMGEDRPAPAAGAAPTQSTAEALMASEAYRNPKHPDHARVSQQVQAHFAKQYGNQPAI